MTAPTTMTGELLSLLVLDLDERFEEVLAAGQAQDLNEVTGAAYSAWVVEFGRVVGLLQKARPYLLHLGYAVPQGDFPADGTAKEKVEFVSDWRAALDALVRHIHQPETGAGTPN